MVLFYAQVDLGVISFNIALFISDSIYLSFSLFFFSLAMFLAFKKPTLHFICLFIVFLGTILFVSVLISVAPFILLTLGLVCSCFSNSFRCNARLFT
jgi:hypothetical protein